MEYPASGFAQLIYVSRCKIRKVERAEAVRQILIKSISNNRRVDVTGMLLSNDEFFVQLLEGPAENVRLVFERVKDDPRHTDVRLIDFSPSPRRRFRDWNMLLSPLPADTADHDHLTLDQALGLFRR